MTDYSSRLVDAVTEVLEEHRWYETSEMCSCGFVPVPGAFRRHQSEQVVARLAPEHAHDHPIYERVKAGLGEGDWYSEPMSASNPLPEHWQYREIGSMPLFSLGVLFPESEKP